MKKNYIILILLAFSLYSCESAEVQTEEIEPTTSSYSIPDEVADEIEEYSSIGDRIFAESLITPFGSGEIYFTINKAEAFTTMQAAGFEYSDMFEDFLPIESDDWDSEKNTFSDDWILIILDITIENVDATGSDYIDEPEKYNKYDFRIDGLGGCTSGPLVYFSEMGKCSSHVYAFHLEPGESIDVKTGYLVYLPETELKDVQFLTPTSTIDVNDLKDNEQPYIKVDLNLG